MKSIQAIIFDKDGTLMDFDSFWVTVSIKAIEDILEQINKTDVSVEEILEALGVHQGVTSIDGILCHGTYEQMGQAMHDILSVHGCSLPCPTVTDMVVDAYNRHAHEGEVKPTCPNLADLLTAFKHQGIKLAVVTTDNEVITRQCLQRLGIEELFDVIYTDDGVTPTKPNPFCVHDFCQKAGIEKEYVVMVGDTMTDVRFAQNAGIKVVSLAQSEGNRAILAPHADVVIPSLSHLAEVLA